MAIEFEFRPFWHPLFGEQYRPYAVLQLSHAKYSVWADFLIDSGADVTLIPYKVGLNLGLNIQLDEPVYTLGGVAMGLPVVYRTIQVQIGVHEISCRIAWALSERAPSVLGRLDIFDTFHVEFRQEERKTVFTKV